MTSNEVSMLDDIAADNTPPVTPDEYPPGTPELKPYLQIRPLSRRGEFKRTYAKFARMQEEALATAKSGVLKDDGNVSPERMADKLDVWGDMDDLYQVMDDLMHLAAKDPDAYRAWSDTLEKDEDRATAFQVYMKRSQPGEASSSAT